MHALGPFTRCMSQCGQQYTRETAPAHESSLAKLHVVFLLRFPLRRLRRPLPRHHHPPLRYHGTR